MSQQAMNFFASHIALQRRCAPLRSRPIANPGSLFDHSDSGIATFTFGLRSTFFVCQESTNAHFQTRGEPLAANRRRLRN